MKERRTEVALAVGLVVALGWNLSLQQASNANGRALDAALSSVEQASSDVTALTSDLARTRGSSDDAAAAAAATHRRLTGLEERLGGVLASLEDLDGAMTDADGERLDLAGFLTQLDRDISGLKRDLRDMQGIGYSTVSGPTLTDLDGRVDALSTQVNRLGDLIEDVNCEVRRVASELAGGWTPVFC